MATSTMAQLPGLPSWGQGWLTSYLGQAGLDDVARSDMGRGARWWHHLFDGVAGLTEGHLQRLSDRMERQAAEIGTVFRLPGDGAERAWPLAALPLLIGEDEWQDIAAGVAQRAELLERLLADIYGEQRLVADGRLPPAVIAGSADFRRTMLELAPPGGHRLHIYAVDLGRDPNGEWRVLADHVRTPAGAGYALENRLATSRVMGPLHTRLNLHRLAGFFAGFREGLAAACHRSEPRIALLTPGRLNSSYAEQAHLARYLGMLLVEGDDLAVRDAKLFVRTIEGLKRVDALWRRVDSRFLDPLTFDATSQIGVPGLIDAMAAGNAVVANAPGVGVVEAPSMAAFLPALASHLLGETLILPNVATWWCGQEGPAADVIAQFDDLLIGPAFADTPLGLPDGQPVVGGSLSTAAKARLRAAMAMRPQDYVGQEVVRLSTMPAVIDGRLLPRPFTLRAFAARDGQGRWTVMPGGFARLADTADVRAPVIGDGGVSADVGVVGLKPVDHVSLLPVDVPIRRIPGTLTSRAADNLFWLGRYLERGEATLRLVRAALGSTIDADGGASLQAGTLDRLATMLIATGAASEEADDDEDGAILELAEVARGALDGPGVSSVRSIFATSRAIGEGMRDRLSADFWRLIEAWPATGGGGDGGAMLARVGVLQERFAALAGLAAENMGRTAGWRFHDLGRRLERALTTCRMLRAFARDDAGSDDLAILLDLADIQISYRARYMTGVALVPARDLVALDPYNPRSLSFQVARIAEHLAGLPSLRDDGMPEPQDMIATELVAAMSLARAEGLGPDAVMGFENRLLALSDAIGRRFFLQGGETFRQAAMTLG